MKTHQFWLFFFSGKGVPPSSYSVFFFILWGWIKKIRSEIKCPLVELSKKEKESWLYIYISLSFVVNVGFFSFLHPLKLLKGKVKSFDYQMCLCVYMYCYLQNPCPLFGCVDGMLFNARFTSIRDSTKSRLKSVKNS